MPCSPDTVFKSDQGRTKERKTKKRTRRRTERNQRIRTTSYCGQRRKFGRLIFFPFYQSCFCVRHNLRTRNGNHSYSSRTGSGEGSAEEEPSIYRHCISSPDLSQVRGKIQFSVVPGLRRNVKRIRRKLHSHHFVIAQVLNENRSRFRNMFSVAFLCRLSILHKRSHDHH